MQDLLVRCGGCRAELSVPLGGMADALAREGWTMHEGKSLCARCTPDRLARPNGPGAFTVDAPPLTVGSVALERPNPDAALRARINAGVIDNVIVNACCAVILAVFGVTAASLDAACVFIVAQFLYFFWFEGTRGRSPGKRRYGLEVVRVDGRPLDVQAVALRNALRVIDSFPIFYASGLFSVMRTGRARRQRIGDVVAKTQVISSDPLRQQLRTPRWLLPTATSLALLLAGGFALGAVSLRSRRPITPAFEASFVAGCTDSGTPSSDCHCVFAKLRDNYGYTTQEQFADLAERIRRAIVARDLNQMPSQFVNAVLTCHPGAAAAPTPAGGSLSP